MKRFHKIATGVLIAGAIVTGAGVYNSSLASADDQKAATKVAIDYASAVTSADASKMLQNVKDTRMTDAAAQKAKYENYYVKQETKRHTKLKFIKLEDTSDGFKADFEISSDEYKATPVTLPMTKDSDGNWKILIDGSVVLDTHNQTK